MSFFGGGTDIPSFFEENGGAVISSSFDKYCYVTVRHLPPFFEYKTELSYSRLEQVRGVDELEHPLVREAMKMLRMRDLRITYEADLPARSGLGTSSSFAVGLLNAFHALKDHQVSKRRLADEAIYLERAILGEEGGWQDQIAASFGGFNKILFGPAAEEALKKEPYTPDVGQKTPSYPYAVVPIDMKEERKEQLNRNLMMFFTGFTRFSAEIQKINSNGGAQRQEALRRIYELVPEAEAILTDEQRSLDEFGLLLDESWQMKRRSGAGVSNSAIDTLYQEGKKAGALGGKLLGAGGGGFMVFYVRPEERAKVKQAMKDLLYIPFSFENQGSQILYYAPEALEE